MNRPKAIQEAAKRIEGAKLQLQHLQDQLKRTYLGQDDPDAVEIYYRAFLDTVYSFQQHLKNQDKLLYRACLATLPHPERQYIEGMWSRRTGVAHGTALLKLDKKNKPIRPELAGVTVVGPPSALTEDARRANEAVGIPPGWLGAVIAKTYHIPTNSGYLEVTEACARCLPILEELLARFAK
jgi:hypothetical protein